MRRKGHDDPCLPLKASRGLIQVKTDWREPCLDCRLINLGKEIKPCHVEPSFRSLHPLSSASQVLRLFQLTPPHIEEVALRAPAFTMVASIAGACIAVQPYAVEWR
jgi:hypothetical protein